MSTFYYNPGEIVLPITIEEAKSMYDAGIDHNCPGPNRVQELKIWWKPKGVYKAFECFCQDCYWKGKLTSPTNVTYKPEELEPCYIKGLLCNCDGEDRKDYFKLKMKKDLKLAIGTCNEKGHFTKINDELKILNITLSQSIKEFEGKNMLKRLVIPNKGKRISFVFEYGTEELSKYTYITNKFVGIKTVYAGKFNKPNSKVSLIKKGKFISHVKDDDLLKTKYSNLSYESSKKVYADMNKKKNINEMIYKLPNEPPEYNIDFKLDKQNILYYNFQLILMVAKGDEDINFNEYISLDVHIVPEKQIEKVYDFLKVKSNKKKEKEISEIVL